MDEDVNQVLVLGAMKTHMPILHPIFYKTMALVWFNPNPCKANGQNIRLATALVNQVVSSRVMAVIAEAIVTHWCNIIT